MKENLAKRDKEQELYRIEFDAKIKRKDVEI
jgi:hypothetical protein